MTEEKLNLALDRMITEYKERQIKAYKDDNRILATILQHFIDYSYNLKTALNSDSR